jgi:F-type H+-transporting ATPase subunit delta
MAELATIARPYADALYKALGSDASEWLDELAGVASNKSLLQFSGDPRVTADQLYGLVSSVIQTSLPDAGANFLRLVIENGRLSALPEVAAQYRVLKNTAGGSADAVVYSAFPIDGSALSDLAVQLEKRFARKLNVSTQIDESLIGGVRVVVGDEVMDTSIKARLEQMKVALTA